MIEQFCIAMLFLFNLILGSYQLNELLPVHHDAMFYAMLNDATVMSKLASQQPSSIVENKMVLTYNKETGLLKEHVMQCLRCCFLAQEQLIPKPSDYVMIVIHGHAGIFKTSSGKEYRFSLGGDTYLKISDVYTSLEMYFKHCTVILCFNTCASDVVEQIRFEFEHCVNNEIVGQQTKLTQIPLEELRNEDDRLNNNMPSEYYHVKETSNSSPQIPNLFRTMLPLQFPVFLIGMNSDTVTLQSNLPDGLTQSGYALNYLVENKLNFTVKQLLQNSNLLAHNENNRALENFNCCLLFNESCKKAALELLERRIAF
ncbi:MAG: hypothetical protein JNM95_12535 [Chitinophagaceae bacterium]|nr:hypothetical protein [Chitinophagaceae bacterium]